MKKLILILVLFAVAILIARSQHNKKENPVVTNFEECIEAGNPAMESYPRQCIHDGQSYVEDINIEENPNTTNPDTTNPPTDFKNGALPDPVEIPENVTAVVSRVADETGIGGDFIEVLGSSFHEWPDGCLGLAGPGEFCTQVITQGFRVTVKAGGKLYIYRTNVDGSVLRKEN